MEKLIECVPNFSEGRDTAVIRQITDAIEAVEGVKLLDVDPGQATNRTVVTFVGAPEAVIEAAVRRCARRPSSSTWPATPASTRASAPRTSARWCRWPASPWTRRWSTPASWRAASARRSALTVYCYEHAAARTSGATSRPCAQGEYEGLEAKLADPAGRPDFGPASFNAALGRDRRRRARLPGGLQRQPQHDLDPPRQRHRLRRAREGPHQARGQPAHRRGRPDEQGKPVWIPGCSSASRPSAGSSRSTASPRSP